MMSVTEWRSEAELTLGITTASMLGALSYSTFNTSILRHFEHEQQHVLHTTSVKSSRAYPESIEFMRTAFSPTVFTRGCSRNLHKFLRASAFFEGRDGVLQVIRDVVCDQPAGLVQKLGGRCGHCRFVSNTVIQCS